jgi:hypothetical protein
VHNVGFFSMERRDKVMIYVHSKLLIIDDKLASIGNANAKPLNPTRSTREYPGSAGFCFWEDV